MLRRFQIKHGAFLLLAIAAALVCKAFAVEVVDLRCEGQASPLGAGKVPALSWRITAGERGQRQTAWRILVASDKNLLGEGRADLWDSGKTPARRDPNVRYAGKPLPSGGICHWMVRCWDASGKPSAWSDPAVFEVAPHEPADWLGARWIDDGRDNPERDEDFYQDDPAPLLRREFSIAKPVVRARLHVAGLGYAYPSLNGKRVADHVLDPPWTDFGKRVHFRTHDVTDQVVDGSNCLGLTLGNGWFNPLPLRMWGGRNIRDALPTGRPRAIALLVVDHPDGTSSTVRTGDGWMTRPGPTLRNSIYLGETRDARRDPSGWDRSGAAADGWGPARVVKAPLETLQPLAMPPVRLLDPVRAAAVMTPVPGVHVVDFGINFTGIPEIRLDVPAGTRIRLRYGEILHPDGMLNPLTSVCGQIKGIRRDKDGNEMPVGGPGAPEVAWQQDVYIARGGGPEVYRPDFTYHAFRYMEITGLPEAPELGDCTAFHARSDLADAGSFSCSDDRLNRIQELCRRTFLANAVTVQSDCPHRERFGYGGDIVATSDAFLMNFDMERFYAKTVCDWADAARPDGNFTDTAPFVGIQYCGVGWAMVHPLLLEQLHRHYGASDLIAAQVPAAIRWLDLEASKRKDGLVVGGLGDHESLTKSRGPALTTAMFIDAARRVARLARLAGRDDDADRLRKLADESASAWAKRFLDPSTGGIGGGTQSELAFALGFGAAPVDARSAVFSRLVDNLTTPDDGPRLTTGIFGTRMVMEELSRNHRSDIAFALAKRDRFPSWGHMLENGATTLWETWKESDNTYSHNHPMFGSISAWFFRWLGGIQPADDAVGFDRILIRPQVVDGLDWVKTSHRTIRGPLVSNWQREGDTLRFDITIPPGARARIDLPAKAGDLVAESGRPVDSGSGFTMGAGPSGHRRFDVGSGRYRFDVRPAR